MKRAIWLPCVVGALASCGLDSAGLGLDTASIAGGGAGSDATSTAGAGGGTSSGGGGDVFTPTSTSAGEGPSGTTGGGDGGGSAQSSQASSGVGGTAASTGSMATGTGGSGGEGGTVVPSFCGDGVLDAGEQCDDGNTTPKDGCSPMCRYEVTSECPGTAVVLDQLLVLSGDTTGDGSNLAASCGGGMANEAIYAVHPAHNGKLTATVSADFESIVYLRSGCTNGQELACDDNGTVDVEGNVDKTKVYFVVVDGDGGQEGPFVLTLQLAN